MSSPIAGSGPPGSRPASRFARLSLLDLMFLEVETAAWPCLTAVKAAADAHGFPGLDALIAGMESDGRALPGSRADSEPLRGRANTPAAGR